MNDFLDSIKVTTENKKRIMSNILFKMMYSTTVLSLSEILENENNDINKSNINGIGIKSNLSQNEILAIYSLAREIKISTMTSSGINKKLFKYLELDTRSLNTNKLLEFINEAVKDIEITKKKNPNIKWNLQIGKIFTRLEEKNLEDREVIEYRSNTVGDKDYPIQVNRGNKIIKLKLPDDKKEMEITD